MNASATFIYNIIAGLLCALLLCRIDSLEAKTLSDCEISAPRAARAAAKKLSMQPDYYNLQLPQTIVFIPGMRHCYIGVDAFTGEAEFRVIPRQSIVGKSKSSLRLSLLKIRSEQPSLMYEIPPGSDGSFRFSFSGEAAVLDFQTLRRSSSRGSVYFVERRVIANAESQKLTGDHPLVVHGSGPETDVETAIKSGPLLEFTVAKNSRVSIAIGGLDDKALCEVPEGSGYRPEELSLSNSALNPFIVYRVHPGSIIEPGGVTVVRDSRARIRLLALLHAGTYFIQVGPLLACKDAPAALSVSLNANSPEFGPAVLAVNDWMSGTPLGGRIEAVAIERDVIEDVYSFSMGDDPPANIHPTTRVWLRSNFYCDDSLEAFRPIAVQAGRLAALATNVKTSDIVVHVVGGNKNFRVLFDPLTGRPWVDNFAGGCAGGGEEPIPPAIVQSFDADAATGGAPLAFSSLVRRFIEAGFPQPAISNFDFPGSEDAIALRLLCVRGEVDQSTTNILGGQVLYWQRLDLLFSLLGRSTPRIRVEAHGLYTEGGGQGSAHCPAEGQFTKALDGRFDPALNSFALGLARRFVRFAEAARSSRR